MNRLLGILICFAAPHLTNGQPEKINVQSDPKLVMEEIFRAAKTRDYSNLSKFCPPNGENDGDTQEFICSIASSSEKVKEEFTSYFENAYINGEVTYTEAADGSKRAKVPFWFNHPGGESRSNEIMNLILIADKWYLLSF